MRKRLIELCMDAAISSGIPSVNMPLLADHLLAEGVIVPLCKVGDTVYQINKTPCGGEVYELDVFDVSLKNGKPYYETESIDFDDTAIGRSIFLTRDDAEKALKEAQG